MITGFRIYVSEIFRDELYWTALGAGSFENLVRWIHHLGPRESRPPSVMVLCSQVSQRSSSLVVHFVVFFASWCFPQGKHGFLHGMLVFPASFAEEKADKEQCSLF